LFYLSLVCLPLVYLNLPLVYFDLSLAYLDQESSSTSPKEPVILSEAKNPRIYEGSAATRAPSLRRPPYGDNSFSKEILKKPVKPTYPLLISSIRMPISFPPSGTL
jgi:hypothetical protein